LTSNGNELPTVAGWMEYKLQYPVGVGLGHLAVRDWRFNCIQLGTASADNEFPDSVHRICHTVRVLGREAFIDMFMTI